MHDVADPRQTRPPRRRAPIIPLRPADRTRPRLAPLIGAADAISSEQDALLTDLARDARAGDREARDALYRALAPKVARFVAAYVRPAVAAGGPRRDDRPWDLDDIAQEAFPAFVALLEGYSGLRPFGPYFLAAYPWRLRDAWRRLQEPARLQFPEAPADLPLREDPAAVAEEARVLVETIAADLGTPDGDILRWRVVDGLPLYRIAAELGLGRATVARRWEAIRATLGTGLAAERPAPTGRGSSGSSRAGRGGGSRGRRSGRRG